MISKLPFFKTNTFFFCLLNLNPIFNFFNLYLIFQLKVLVNTIKLIKLIWLGGDSWKHLLQVTNFNNFIYTNKIPVTRFNCFYKNDLQLKSINLFLVTKSQIFFKNNHNVLSTSVKSPSNSLTSSFLNKTFPLIHNYYLQIINNKQFFFIFLSLLQSFRECYKFLTHLQFLKKKSLRLSYNFKGNSINKLVQYNWKLI